jgi:hypothetical protein
VAVKAGIRSMRGATAAGRPTSAATAAMRSSSQSESTSSARMPAFTATAISARVFATPLKTICRGANPTRSALSSSPPELTSTLMPASRTTFRNHRLEQALLAKKISVDGARPPKARRSSAML